MICSKKLDATFWAEAVNTTVYTLNMSGTSSKKYKPPYEPYF